MTHARTPDPVGESILRQVLLCDQYIRPEAGLRRTVTSLPGHLIQLTVRGRSEHEVGGRRHLIEPGSLVWFHEDEWVRTHVTEAPWSFYTVNFIAPALEPPPFELRVRQVGDDVRQAFETLLEVWRDRQRPPVVRDLRVHSTLLHLIAAVVPQAPAVGDPAPAGDASAGLWWQLESRLRQDLAQPINLTRLMEMTGRSPATLSRACHAAVGQPPMKRIKHIRLSLARGLVRRSHLSITEIAHRVGYARLHELSRDYRNHFGLSPRADRQQWNQ